MKQLLVTLLLTFALAASAQTNARDSELPKEVVLTFTNRQGEVFNAVKVVKVLPDGILYTNTKGGRGGKVLFADLPEETRRMLSAFTPIEILKNEANKGNDRAMMKLAEIYTVGDGVPTNALEGEKWFVKAAQLGNSNAATALGDLFMQRHESNIIDPETGLPSPFSGDDPDLKQATNWYHKAAEAGDPYGQIKLSQYYKGEALPINPNTGLPVTNLTNEAEAFKWYDKAFQTLTDRAEKRDQTAQAALARWQSDAPNSWIDAKKPWTNAVHLTPPSRVFYRDNVPPSVYNSIRAAAEAKWPGDYDMQFYEIKKQTEAYKKLNP